MARWKLQVAHYLRVPGTAWEQVETDRETGRQRRKAYPVPMLLDPKDPQCWSHRPGQGHVTKGGSSWDEGQIIVAYEGKTNDSRDIIFEGDPTPDMDPLDDEAREISSRYHWWDKKGRLDDQFTSFSEAKLDEAAKMFADANAFAMKEVLRSPAVNDSMLESQKQMMEMMTKMGQAMTAMMGQIAHNGRRV